MTRIRSSSIGHTSDCLALNVWWIGEQVLHGPNFTAEDLMMMMMMMMMMITSGLTWGPSLDDLSVRAAAVDYASRCSVCQMHSRTTCYDRVPIQAVPREPVVFRHMYMDIFGEILPGVKLVHNYALVVVCSATRFPFAYPLRAPTTKNVCDALQKMFEYTGIPSEMVITCDNASYFKSALMREFQKRLGIAPRYSTPWHPEGHALIERHLQTLQQVLFD